VANILVVDIASTQELQRWLARPSEFPDSCLILAPLVNHRSKCQPSCRKSILHKPHLQSRLQRVGPEPGCCTDYKLECGFTSSSTLCASYATLSRSVLSRSRILASSRILAFLSHSRIVLSQHPLAISLSFRVLVLSHPRHPLAYSSSSRILIVDSHPRHPLTF
jgi:hypothetical protein